MSLVTYFILKISKPLGARERERDREKRERIRSIHFEVEMRIIASNNVKSTPEN